MPHPIKSSPFTLYTIQNTSTAAPKISLNIASSFDCNVREFQNDKKDHRSIRSTLQITKSSDGRCGQCPSLQIERQRLAITLRIAAHAFCASTFGYSPFRRICSGPSSVRYGPTSAASNCPSTRTFSNKSCTEKAARRRQTACASIWSLCICAHPARSAKRTSPCISRKNTNRALSANAPIKALWTQTAVRSAGTESPGRPQRAGPIGPCDPIWRWKGNGQ